MPLSPQQVLPILLNTPRADAVAPAPKRFCISFSGGLDSSVLLRVVTALRPLPNDIALIVFHVDHSLTPKSIGWSLRCESVCRELAVEYRSFRVDARPAPGESPEAAARRARYGVLEAQLEAGDYLLTAHHQDDQAETLLLQLLRGAGPRGLAAMPVLAPLGRGWIMRPLLGFTRDQLKSYAEAASLDWIEDESNFDTGFDRNFLRRKILPRLQTRWPSLAATLSRSAGLCAEAAQVLDGVAEADLQAAATDQPAALCITALLGLDTARLGNALVLWFRRLGLASPSQVHIERLVKEVLLAAPDSTPCLSWQGVEVRRYRDVVYAGEPLPAQSITEPLYWDTAHPLTIPTLGVLSAEPVEGRGLARHVLETQAVTVRFRHGGERCRPVGRQGSHPLKKLFQEKGVPFWQRQRVPLVYVGEQLAAVADFWVCEPFQAGPGEAGFAIRWQQDSSAAIGVSD